MASWTIRSGPQLSLPRDPRLPLLQIEWFNRSYAPTSTFHPLNMRRKRYADTAPPAYKVDIRTAASF
jgi:hypothetical protein